MTSAILHFRRNPLSGVCKLISLNLVRTKRKTGAINTANQAAKRWSTTKYKILAGSFYSTVLVNR